MAEPIDAAGPPGSIRVAIVDDHRLVIDGLAARLAAEAPSITVVTTHFRWRDLLKDPAFPVDVVVLDLHMEDNIPIGTKIRALGAAGAEAIVMSRHADSASVSAAMQAGALGFVVKTDPADYLVDAIRSAARHERFLAAPLESRVAAFSETPDAGLGRQEQRALILYASGRSVREVAEDMQTTEETVKSYIKRGRRKYRQVGVDIGTRILLRRYARRQGWLNPEQSP